MATVQVENLGIRTGIGLSSDELIRQIVGAENLLGIDRLPIMPGTLDALLPRMPMERGKNKVQRGYTVELEVEEAEEAQGITKEQLPQIAINEATVRRYAAKAVVSDRAEYASPIALLSFIAQGMSDGFSVAAARSAVDSIQQVPLTHGTSTSTFNNDYIADFVDFLAIGNATSFKRSLTRNIQNGVIVVSRAQLNTWVRALQNVYVVNGSAGAATSYNSGDEAIRGHLEGLTAQAGVRFIYDDNIPVVGGTNPSAVGVAAFNHGLAKITAPIEKQRYAVEYDAETGKTKIIRQGHWGYGCLNPFQATKIESAAVA